MKKVLNYIIIVFLFIIPPYLCTIISAKQNLELSQTSTGDEHYRYLFEALSWRSPFNLYAYQAKYELEKIAFSENPDSNSALLNLKRGLMKSRSWNFTSDQIEIQKINKLIERNSGAEKKIVEDVDTTLHFLTYLLSGLSFWCWIAATICTICFGFDKNGNPIIKKIIYGFASTSIFFVTWLLIIY